MNGAQSLIQTLVNGGVNICFTNPGTSELYFVDAFDKVRGMRPILGLFEGVCTGAADGYARMASRPAATLLHLGPGLGNGFANLHNARRANSPVVNIVGDHATTHLAYDAPLTTDIASVAGAVSGWVRSSRKASDVPADAASAIAASMKPPGQVATLILPADCSWSESAEPAPAPVIPGTEPADPAAIRRIADVLRKKEPTIILLAGNLLMEEGLRLASRISKATGARIMGNRVNGRTQRGAGRAVVERLPYPIPPALKLLEGTSHLVLVGTKPPVSFFAYPGMPSWLTPENCQIHTLATEGENGVEVLEALAEELNAPDEPALVYELDRPPLPTGDITPEKVWRSLVALMPENSIISDESVTSGREAEQWTTGAPPHDWLNVTGGAIGQGMPVAVGAAVACPDRKVFSMQSDGAGMYTLQALWTQAREKLDIVTVIFANRAYKILQGELKSLCADDPGRKAREVLELSNPDLDWVKLAGGMGVPATRATTAKEFNRRLQTAVRTTGPHLIEVVI